MTKDEAIKRFGFDPESVGNRPRGWWIVDKIEDEEEYAGAKIGDLCVKTRDGGGNPVDPSAFKVGNCIGSQEDDFDRTYRYYYYRARQLMTNLSYGNLSDICEYYAEKHSVNVYNIVIGKYGNCVYIWKYSEKDSNLFTILEKIEKEKP